MKRTTHLLLTLLFIAPVVAQQRSGLTLQELIKIALDLNPTVLAARSTVEEAQARVKQARSAFYPQLNFSGLAKAGLGGTMNGLNPLGLANSPFFDNYAILPRST